MHIPIVRVQKVKLKTGIRKVLYTQHKKFYTAEAVDRSVPKITIAQQGKGFVGSLTNANGFNIQTVAKRTAEAAYQVLARDFWQ